MCWWSTILPYFRWVKLKLAVFFQHFYTMCEGGSIKAVLRVIKLSAKIIETASGLCVVYYIIGYHETLFRREPISLRFWRWSQGTACNWPPLRSNACILWLSCTSFVNSWLASSWSWRVAAHTRALRWFFRQLTLFCKIFIASISCAVKEKEIKRAVVFFWQTEKSRIFDGTYWILDNVNSDHAVN